MDRFKTLPSVLYGAEGRPLKFIEELSLVISIAAGRVKGELQETHEATQQKSQRVAMAGVVAIVLLTGLAVWWAQSEERTGLIPWVLGLGFVALGGTAIYYVTQRRQEQLKIQNEGASVTRLGRFYWPIGVVPLSKERAVIWDSATGSDEPLQVMELPPGFGEDSLEQVRSAEGIHEAFDALLHFSSGLEHFRPQSSHWPGTRPDESAMRMGNELSYLWGQMSDMDPSQAAAALPQSASTDHVEWTQVEKEGDRLHTFYRAVGKLRATVERYQDRAEKLVDSAREVLIDRHWRVIAEIDEERKEYFTPGRSIKGFGDRALPTGPDAQLLLTSGNSAAQVEQSLNQLQEALSPLDEAITNELKKYDDKEATDMAELEKRLADRRKILADDKQKLELLDSDIMTLGTRLEEQQEKIFQIASEIQEGFKGIEQVPLESLQRQLHDLHAALNDSCALIDQLSETIELDSIEDTLAQLQTVTGEARVAWQKLAEEMPARSGAIGEKVDSMLTKLDDIASGTVQADPESLKQLQSEVKEVERVARLVVSWAASRDDPIDPVEVKDEELAKHLVALREQRQKLERASEIMGSITSETSERSLTLLDNIERSENALNAFVRLSNETSSSVTAMDNAAASVKLQAEQIQKLLGEREQLLQAFEAKVTRLQEQEEQERAKVREKWQKKREKILSRREQLNRLAESVGEQLSRSREEPDINRMGVISEELSSYWSDLVVNQMGLGIDLWAQRIAGVDGATEGSSYLDQLRNTLEQCIAGVEERSIPIDLADYDGEITPRLCFIPFWYVETESQPGHPTNQGREIHIFPPLQLKARNPTEAPEIESFFYPEVTRRLLSHLQQRMVEGPLTSETLTIEPDELSEHGKRLDPSLGAVPMHEIATALAQHWVFFRTTDQTLNQIIQNSRDRLIPETEIIETWSRSVQQQPTLANEEAPTHERLPQSDPLLDADDGASDKETITWNRDEVDKWKQNS